MKNRRIITNNIYKILYDASSINNDGVRYIHENDWPIDKLVELVDIWQNVARYQVLDEAELLGTKKRKTND